VASLGGQPGLVPWALVLVNVAGMAALAWAGALIARQAGRAAPWGLLVAGPSCYLFSLGYDLTELVAGALLAWALVHLRRGHHRSAAALLSLGALTRESVLVTVAAVGLTRLVALARSSARPGRADLPWLVPLGCFLGWQLICHHTLGTFPATSGDQNLGAPFVGLAAGFEDWYSATGRALIITIHFVLVAAVTASVLPQLRRTAAPVHERVAWVLWLPYAACMSATVWTGWGEFRTISDLQLLSAVLLLGAPRRPAVQAGLQAAGWSLTAVLRVIHP
jgi:hypothetical protein